MKTLRSFLNTFQAINFVSSGQCSDEDAGIVIVILLALKGA